MQQTITKSKDGHQIIDGAGEMIAEMTFSSMPGALIIDHTYVRDDNRGEGLGKVLLESVIGMARDEGLKVIPLCPFVRAQVDREPARYADVVYQGMSS